MDGDAYVVSFAEWLRAHEARLAQGNVLSLLQQQRSSSSSWFSSPKALMLSLDLYHLCYLLVRFEEAGLPIGASLDTRFHGCLSRPISLASILPPPDTSDTKSFISASFSWFSAAGPHSTSGAQAATDLKYLYSAFTKLPSLQLSPYPKPPFQKQIQDFHMDPLAPTYVPLYVFKNLSHLIIQDLDPRILLGWDFLADALVSLEVKNTGIDDFEELLIDRVLDDAHLRQGVDTKTSDEPRQLRRSQWYALKRLSLAASSLTSVPSAPWEVSFANVVHLDLSSNLLVSVPPGLSYLVSLRSLNLSDNMIDTLLSISSNIGAIATLNLSKNRLSSLCGLERLLNLESIDVTENRIEEAEEVGRLAALPHLRILYAGSGNHFSSASQWRVRLFAAFALEGNIGIEIDGSRPGWNESRLIAREVARRPMARRIVSEAVPSGSAAPETSRQVIRAKSPAPARPTSPEGANATGATPITRTDHKRQRRKKPKRVVDLGNGKPPSLDALNLRETPVGEETQASPSPVKVAPKLHQRSVTEMPSNSSARGSDTGTDSIGRGARRLNNRSSILPTTADAAPSHQPDEFRKRIEALRNEVGEDWLRVWNAQSEEQHQQQTGP